MDIKKQILTALGLEKTNFEFQAKLTDGTIIVSTAPELEAGVDIAIMTEDGTTMPLPVGAYETEDGVGFTVAEDGIVEVDLAAENKALKAKLEELGKSAGAESLNINKFSTAKPKAEMSKTAYSKLTAKEKFAYNLNN